MVDIEALNREIEEVGITLPVLARKANIPYRNLYNKLKGNGDLKASEIKGIKEVLKLKPSKVDRIFFN